MTKKNAKTILGFTIIFYIIAAVLMIIGGRYDLKIDLALFNPQSNGAISFEAFGQLVYWGMWGPLFTVLFLTSHNLNECLEIIGRVFPFIKPIKNIESKAYKFFNLIITILWKIAFFVLGVVGWKKLIENILKKYFEISQPIYFVICAVVMAIGLVIFSRIDKKVLNKLESLALAGVVLGICYKIVESCKEITSRIRFREMVAASNGVYDEEGLSGGALEGLASGLYRDMKDSTDFGAFTQWYKKGDDLGIYSHANSFPSGHTTYSCTLYLSAILCTAFEKLKKFAPIAFIISFIYVGIMAYFRMVAGAHYLTDVVGGAVIGYTLFIIVWAIYDKFNKKGILPTR